MTAASYTAFETLLLFRGVAKYGFQEEQFASISSRILSADPVKADPRFNADRLRPKALQELFLDLLWEQLKQDANAASRHDEGSLSPSSKKRKLQHLQRPKLEDAWEHVDKFEHIHRRLYGSYVQETLRVIDDLDQEYSRRFVGQERTATAQKTATPKSFANKEQPAKSAITNGVGPPPPRASPRPAPAALTSQAPVPPTQAAPAPAIPPPQSTVQPGVSAPSPAPLPTPAFAQPQLVQSSQPQPRPQPSPRPAAHVPPPASHNAQNVARPPAPVSPVLQLPQGGPSLQPAASPSTSQQTPAIPPNPQGVAQSQLKWEPPYQPGPGMARPPLPSAQQQAGQGVVQPPHPVAQQRPPPQHVPQLPQRVLPPQTNKATSPPVLVSPQPTGQYSPALQPTPGRPGGDAVGPPAARQPLLAPNVPPNRPTRPGYSQGQMQPVHGQATASAPAPAPPMVPTQQRPHPGPGQLPPSRAVNQPLQAPPTYTQLPSQPAPSPSPALPQADTQLGHNTSSPGPLSAVPDRVRPQRLPGISTPAPPPRVNPLHSAPQTPALPFNVGNVGPITGSSTRWGISSSPSTPVRAPGSSYFSNLASHYTNEVPQSPAYELLSPVLQPAALPSAGLPSTSATTQAPREQKKSSPTQAPEQHSVTPPKRKVGRPRNTPRAPDGETPAQGAAASSSSAGAPPAPSASEQSQLLSEPEMTKIKDEVTTPLPLTETGDTTADESVAGRKQSRRSTKRKREELSPTPLQTPVGRHYSLDPDFSRLPPAPVAPPGKVLWTRQFNKVSGSAMDQIIHHRFANMFAAPIRERDAPGYTKVILQPQDLKSIKAAINAGNRAATQAAAALPGGDPNTSSVWLPISESLIPPKGIINSSQLEREFAHMFANAIMYNPDPADREARHTHNRDALGYEVDEYSVVNDTRDMEQEVTKLLHELRSLEVQRIGGGRAGALTGTSTRQASATIRDGSMARDEGDEHSHVGGDDADEHTPEVETPVGNVAKRRRTARG